MSRLFIAINLPFHIKDLLEEEVNKIKNNHHQADIRFTSPEQWHLTLIFFGYQEEKFLKNIEEAMQNASSQIMKPIKIYFEKITYGPPGPRARMIWLTTTTETSAALDKVKKTIENELLKAGVKWDKENRPFHGHLTLARFEMMALKNLAALDENFNYGFEADKIDLMKSTLRREGALYEKLFSV